jgi:hypothetical protein
MHDNAKNVATTTRTKMGIFIKFIGNVLSAERPAEQAISWRARSVMGFCPNCNSISRACGPIWKKRGTAYVVISIIHE